MEEKLLIVFSIPIVWFIAILVYKIISLFCLWIKYKFESIKGRIIKKGIDYLINQKINQLK